MYPKQKLYQLMLSFALNLQISALLTYKQLSLSSLCKLKQNTLVKLFFSAAPVLSLIPSVGSSAKTKKLFFGYQYEMKNYYQRQKLQYF